MVSQNKITNAFKLLDISLTASPFSIVQFDTEDLDCIKCTIILKLWMTRSLQWVIKKCNEKV